MKSGHTVLAAHALNIHAARLLPTAANRTVWEQINAVTRTSGGSQASTYFFRTCPLFLIISAVTGQRIDAGIGMRTVFFSYREDDKVLFLLQFGQTDRASWICSGYFCLFFFLFFFGSKPAAGRRGWNTVRSAEWFSEGRPNHAKNTADLWEETFWKVNALRYNCSSSPGCNREAVRSTRN